MSIILYSDLNSILLSGIEYDANIGSLNEVETLIPAGQFLLKENKLKIIASKGFDGEQAVVLATVTAKRDIEYTDKEVDTVLPIGLLIVNDNSSKTLLYYSECPEDADHENIIRQAIEQIHLKLIKGALAKAS